MTAAIPHAAARRHALQAALGLAAAPLLFGSSAALAQTPAPGVITRPIPKTGEALPALGLGTFLTFDLLPGAPRDDLRSVVQRYWEAGVRVLDTSPLYGSGESTAGDFVTALGINQQLFMANKLWTTGDFLADESHALASFEQSQQRLWRQRFDLMQCHSLVNVDVTVPLLNVWKKEGRTRHVGVTHHENDYHDVLAAWLARGNVDFLQVNYSIFNRGAEQRLLPVAQERGVAVLVNMALEKGRLHKLVQGQPLPPMARDIGAENWAQFFLKWVISHPAVTCCLSATSNPSHAAQNIGALRGALPDKALRERMVRHMETIPGFNQIASVPWYPDKQAQYQGLIRRAQGALRGRA